MSLRTRSRRFWAPSTSVCKVSMVLLKLSSACALNSLIWSSAAYTLSKLALSWSTLIMALPAC